MLLVGKCSLRRFPLVGKRSLRRLLLVLTILPPIFNILTDTFNILMGNGNLLMENGGLLTDTFNLVMENGGLVMENGNLLTDTFNLVMDRGNILMDQSNIDLGRQVAVEQVDLLIRQGLGLLLSKAVFRQVFDESMGVKGNGFAHENILMNGLPSMQSFCPDSAWRLSS